MSRSIADLNEERRNKNAKHSDFPVGTAVKIVTVCRDFHFWYGETGIVTENKGGGSYLGITVKLDEPRVYDGNEFTGGDWTLTEFHFQPEDLRVLKRKPSQLTLLKKRVKRFIKDIAKDRKRK